MLHPEMSTIVLVHKFSQTCKQSMAHLISIPSLFFLKQHAHFGLQNLNILLLHHNHKPDIYMIFYSICIAVP